MGTWNRLQIGNEDEEVDVMGGCGAANEFVVPEHCLSIPLSSRKQIVINWPKVTVLISWGSSYPKYGVVLYLILSHRSEEPSMTSQTTDQWTNTSIPYSSYVIAHSTQTLDSAMTTSKWWIYCFRFRYKMDILTIMDPNLWRFGSQRNKKTVRV